MRSAEDIGKELYSLIDNTAINNVVNMQLANTDISFDDISKEGLESLKNDTSMVEAILRR